MHFSDIEFILLFVIMAVLFLLGLRKRDGAINSKYSGIDLPMSAALKGIACVMILMGHYASRLNDLGDSTRLTMLVYRTTANVALALFMYFSGYGLSVKMVTGGGYLLVWIRRLKKVYLPLLFTCVIAMIFYAILPVKFTLEESSLLSVPKDIWYIHHFNQDSWCVLLPHLFGWKDWYVFCIMIFYTLFYLSLSITRKRPENQTWVLWLMMVAYFVFAYFFFGKSEAHWYRYCWAFFIGHVHGKMVQTEKTNYWDLSMLAVLMATILLESRFMILSYLIAITFIVICSLFNKKFTINSKVLAFMGGISYFFYLSHGRISGVLLPYLGFYSVLFWVFSTIIVSYLLLTLYSLFESRFRIKKHCLQK